ncbi:1-phosphatidylinositol 4,5-bisphosphate phosphodiesterase eta-1 isoform X2 [Pelobates cultripes]|uniref:Phosphoinositide phospholipase C n=1 Tax=Pelobates cultripes TaxID=61616 RepID=A0AAD1RBM5_PELCU|nr:1-phosphatidylinositol 4,5-bisphosphate phosphodiesterase eta-1 isoform X2 [Pelobates cultripes]
MELLRSSEVHDFKIPQSLCDMHQKTAKSRSKSCSTDEDEELSPREVGQMHRLGRRRKTMKLCRALSDLVVYTNSVAAQDIMDDGSTGNVLSFSETRAHQVVQQRSEQFMLYNQKQLTRIYPSAYRIDSSNFNPVPYWNAGIQLVALNYQTEGRMMELNRAKFKVNGNCGYVLKPQQMCKGVFNPFSGDPLPASPKKQLILKVVSGQQLPKPPDSMLGDRGEIIDPFVEVEIIGLPVDCCKEQTRVVDDNGFNPVWEETLTFTVHMPEIALVRFLVWDHDPIGRDFVGQRTVAFSSLMPGYRHVYLEGLTEASIFVHITINEIYGKWSPLILNPSYTILHFLGATKNRQFIGLKGFFNKNSKHGSVESNGHIRKRSISERILRRTASAPAKGRKKTKMVFQESTESKDICCEISGTKEKEAVIRRTSRSLQARPVSMPVDKLLLGPFEPSTSDTSKDTKQHDISSGGMDIRGSGKLLTEDVDISIPGNQTSPFFACTSKNPCQTKVTTHEHIVHKKWKSLHLDCVLRSDDIREFDDTFTSELEDNDDHLKQTGSTFNIPRENMVKDYDTKFETVSINDLSSTMCTDINNLHSTEAMSENDISNIISEVPSVDRSELGSSMSELIRQFEVTDDKTTLTCVSSLHEPNSHTKFSGYSDIFTACLYTPKKFVSSLNNVEKSLFSTADTTIFSSPETSEYSVYTIIHEEDLSHDANCKLMDANVANQVRQSEPNISSSPYVSTYPELQPKSTKTEQAHFEGLVNMDSFTHSNYTQNTPTGTHVNTSKNSSIHNGFQKIPTIPRITQEKDIRLQSTNLCLNQTWNTEKNPKKLFQNHNTHSDAHRPTDNTVSNPHMTVKRQEFCKSHQNQESLYHKHHLQYVPQKVIVQNSSSSSTFNNSKPLSLHRNKQSNSCKSKSLGDLTSEDISCNFESKYKRINKGFLSSGIVEENASLAKSRHQSSDALTEQLRKLMSFDQEDFSKPQCHEHEEVDIPKPLSRKLSSRSQSRVRNIANRAKERQEANKMKHSTSNLNEVVFRNKPPTSSQPVNRHSTGSYIASYYSNLNNERLEGRGIPEGACNSQTYRYNDTFCIDRFNYQTDPSNIDEPEIYFLLRL